MVGGRGERLCSLVSRLRARRLCAKMAAGAQGAHQHLRAGLLDLQQQVHAALQVVSLMLLARRVLQSGAATMAAVAATSAMLQLVHGSLLWGTHVLARRAANAAALRRLGKSLGRRDRVPWYLADRTWDRRAQTSQPLAATPKALKHTAAQFGRRRRGRLKKLKAKQGAVQGGSRHSLGERLQTRRAVSGPFVWLWVMTMLFMQRHDAAAPTVRRYLRRRSNWVGGMHCVLMNVEVRPERGQRQGQPAGPEFQMPEVVVEPGDPELDGSVRPVLRRVPPSQGAGSAATLPQHSRPPDNIRRWAAEHLITSVPDGVQFLVPDESHTRDEEHGWTYGNAPGFSPEQQAELKAMLVRNKAAFAYSNTELPGYSGVVGPFTIKGEGFSKTRSYIAGRRRFSALEQEALDKTFSELEEAGIIKQVPTSDYISSPVTAPKKDESGQFTQIRTCIDLRRINDLCDKQHHGLPRAVDLYDSLGKARFFTKFDMRAGFHQIPIEEQDQCKSGFWWGNRIMVWQRTPFGFQGASSHFQRVMDTEIARAGLAHCAKAFIDDLLVSGDDAAQHIRDVEAVLRMLQRVGLKAHPGKSLVAADRVEYLGHYVSHYGCTPLEAKVSAIRALPTPTSVEMLRSALGLMGYYRCYIPGFSVIAAPLTTLFKKGVVWTWGEEQQTAWATLKEQLCTEGRALRRYDATRPTVLHTDWSKDGIAAVLGQLDEDGNEYMVACASRTCNIHERRYAPYYGEMLAAVWGIKTFRVYLHGAPRWKLVTDHRPLTSLMKAQDLTGQHARWALALQEFDFEIVHRPGALHQNADALSRMPRDDSVDSTGACLDREHVEPSLALLAWVETAHAESATEAHQLSAAEAYACMAHCMAAAAPAAAVDATAPTMSDLIAGNNGTVMDEWEHGDGTCEYAEPPLRRPAVAAAVSSVQGGEERQPAADSGLHSSPPAACVATSTYLALAANAAEQSQEGPADIWADTSTLEYLRTGQSRAAAALPAERKRVAKRAKAYRWHGGKLSRVFWDGSTREVLPPGARQQAVKAMHEQTGHFGVRRTTHLVRQQYWWVGLDADVRTAVRRCELCGRVNAAFNARAPQLNPLPLQGMFYRWGVDLAGPFVKSRGRGNMYVMICVEHWSKVVVLIPIQDKTAECTAFAFRQHVLGYYGASAEVLTDGGREWRGAFEELLEQAFIDHRVSSPMHSQTNGLAERCVQTCKRALRKHCEAAGATDTWDAHLPWIQLAYNCSIQASTKLSPYLMLYAHQPVVPPAIVQRIADPLDLDNAETAGLSVLERARALEQHAIIAGRNLAIAQHRDKLRYAMTHSGAYKPKLRRFAVGDFVYLRRGQQNNTLEVPAKQLVLRVVELRPSGIAILQGKCGGRMSAHVSAMAPCHLPDIDPALDLSLLRPTKDLACEVCNETGDGDRMILCDGCNTGWHTFCLEPPLGRVPGGTWLCQACKQLGVQPQAVAEEPRAQQQAPQGQQQAAAPSKRLFVSRSTRAADARAEALHGSTVERTFKRGHAQAGQTVQGQLSFRGAQHRPYYFEVTYGNGHTEYMTFRTAHSSLVEPAVGDQQQGSQQEVERDKLSKGVLFHSVLEQPGNAAPAQPAGRSTTPRKSVLRKTS